MYVYYKQAPEYKIDNTRCNISYAITWSGNVMIKELKKRKDNITVLQLTQCNLCVEVTSTKYKLQIGFQAT